MAKQDNSSTKTSGDKEAEQSVSANTLVNILQSFTGPWTKRNLYSWLFVIFLVFFIKGCIIDQYTIPTGSMEPTLIGDPRFFRG